MVAPLITAMIDSKRVPPIDPDRILLASQHSVARNNTARMPIPVRKKTATVPHTPAAMENQLETVAQFP